MSSFFVFMLDIVDDQPAKHTPESLETEVEARETLVPVNDETSLSKAVEDSQLSTTIDQAAIDSTDPAAKNAVKDEGQSLHQEESSTPEDTIHEETEVNDEQAGTYPRDSVAPCSSAEKEASRKEDTHDEYQRALAGSSSSLRDSGSSTGSSVEVVADPGIALDHADGVADSKTERGEGSQAGVGQKTRVKSAEGLLTASGAHDQSETSSTGSWVSVDDEIRVRRSKKEKIADPKHEDKDVLKSPGKSWSLRSKCLIL